MPEEKGRAGLCAQRGLRSIKNPLVQGIEKPYGFFDAKEGILRAPEILTDFRAAH